jgi:protein-S-isoprenylcysteine O-methyltransferase Ste14
VTGDKKGRLISTPLGLIAFFGLLALFIFCGVQLDAWLGISPVTGSWRLIVSAVLVAGGLFFAGWTAGQFIKSRGTPVPLNPPPKLITVGLYARVRNPMAFGVFLLMESAAFFLGSPSDIIIFAPLTMILYGFYIKYVEEPELEMRFGQEYRDYKMRVPRFLPRFEK